MTYRKNGIGANAAVDRAVGGKSTHFAVPAVAAAIAALRGGDGRNRGIQAATRSAIAVGRRRYQGYGLGAGGAGGHGSS